MGLNYGTLLLKANFKKLKTGQQLCLTNTILSVKKVFYINQQFYIQANLVKYVKFIKLCKNKGKWLLFFQKHFMKELILVETYAWQNKWLQKVGFLLFKKTNALAWNLNSQVSK